MTAHQISLLHTPIDGAVITKIDKDLIVIQGETLYVGGMAYSSKTALLILLDDARIGQKNQTSLHADISKTSLKYPISIRGTSTKLLASKQSNPDIKAAIKNAWANRQ